MITTGGSIEILFLGCQSNKREVAMAVQCDFL